MFHKFKQLALENQKMLYIALDIPMFLVSFGFIFLTGNLLSAENISLLNGALGVFTILFTIGNALQTVVARRIASAEKLIGIRDFLKASAQISLFLSVPFLIFTTYFQTLISIESVGKTSFIILVLLHVFIGLFRGVLQGTERFLSLWSALALDHVFRIIVILIYMTEELSLSGAWNAVLIASLVHLIFAAFSMPSQFWENLREKSSETLLGKEIIMVAFTNLFLNFLLSIDIIIAGEHLNTAGGSYVTANKFGRILYFIGTSIGIVILPTFSRIITTHTLKTRIILGTFILIPLSAVLAPTAALLLQPLIEFSFPSDVVPSFTILSWTFFANFALASIHLFITWHIAQQTQYLNQLLGVCCIILSFLLWYGPPTELFLIQTISYSVWILTITLAFLAYVQKKS